MYIQPIPEDISAERSVPQGYSGTTFAAEQPIAPAPTEEHATVSSHKEEREEKVKKEESVPTFGKNTGKQGELFSKKGLGGLLSEFPLLSSLLPPPRSHTRDQSDLIQWILIGAAILLFLNDSADDILPLLLLLLLWE